MAKNKSNPLFRINSTARTTRTTTSNLESRRAVDESPDTGPARKAAGKWIRRADSGGLVLFGLLTVGFLGPVLSVRAQASAELKDVSCSAITLVSPGSLSCSVTLSAPAPVGGLVVELTSDSSALDVPPSVLVEGGTSSVVFTAAGSAVSGEEGATVTAVSGAAHFATAVSLLSSTSPAEVIARNSGKCLDVREHSRSAGATVQQWNCDGTENQQWLFVAAADGSYEVKSVNSSMSLAVSRNSISNGAPVIQWPYSGAHNEKWRLEPTAGGYHKLVVESTGKCLDVTGGPSATSDGIEVQQWTCWGGENQAWQLVFRHRVSLTWHASKSSSVAGYYVFRSGKSGGPYTRLSSRLRETSYVDGTVKAGQTYYYATTAVNLRGRQSAFSNQVKATIPTP